MHKGGLKPDSFHFFLTTVSTYKYLGVLLDEHLNFDKTVEELCHSAGRSLGTIIGKFKTLRNVGYNTYTTLYNACVRPNS